MDWTRGYYSEFKLFEVDPNTWTDVDEISDVASASWTRDDSTDTFESGSFEIDADSFSGEKYARLYMYAAQSGGGARVCVSTSLITSPSFKTKGELKTWKVKAYSMLSLLKDVYLPVGWQALRGTDPVEATKSIFRQYLPNGVKILSEPSGYLLSSTFTAENNETVLSMGTKLMKSIDWKIRMSPEGDVLLQPSESTNPVVFIPDNIISMSTLEKSDDWYDAPNVVRLSFSTSSSGGQATTTTIARDESVNSSLSIPVRGREVWTTDTGSDSTDISRSDQAKNKLEELQHITDTVSYTREYIPDLCIGDHVRLYIPKYQIYDIYKITSQKIDCEFGLTIDEEVQYVS